jgi:hypothetical protein
VDCKFEGISVRCKIGLKVVGAVILGLVIVVLPVAIAQAAGANSETPSNAADERFEQDSDPLLSRFTAAPVEPQAPQVRLRGSGEVKSIEIDYTPESRCSDNNWSTAFPTACNPGLRKYETGHRFGPLGLKCEAN